MKDEIRKIVDILKKGGIILYPTDTIWGIGCDATNDKAVEKIYALKRSADKKSMLILVDSIDQAARYVNRAPEVAWQILEIADKPLTVILPDACGVSEALIPDEGTIGLRVTGSEFCQKLIRALGRPIVSTSANLTGEKTPLFFEDITEEIKTGVDYIVDPSFEKASTHKPSSIIRLGPTGEIEIIRE